MGILKVGDTVTITTDLPDLRKRSYYDYDIAENMEKYAGVTTTITQFIAEKTVPPDVAIGVYLVSADGGVWVWDERLLLLQNQNFTAESFEAFLGGE